jgi:5-methyltetrahydropteroyltriglutamate--homocysteine methyltransferase
MINAVAEGHDPDRLSLHLCHGHFARGRGTSGSYEPVIDVLGDVNVRRFAMEFAAPESRGVDVLARFPKYKVLGLGVIDHCDSTVETPELVAERVEAALEHVPAERVTINPDCGFSPSAVNPMDLDEAYLKLKAMCAGAELLRARHG